jgi:plasmid stability protein
VSFARFGIAFVLHYEWPGLAQLLEGRCKRHAIGEVGPAIDQATSLAVCSAHGATRCKTEHEPFRMTRFCLYGASQLVVRNLEDEIVDALRRRAAEHGRSAEAEHREILCAALLPKPRTSLKAHLLAIPKSVGDEDDDDFAFEHRRDPGRSVDL